MQNFLALGAPPLDPRASGGWGLCPQTPSLRRLGAQPPKQPPPYLQTVLQNFHDCHFQVNRFNINLTWISFSSRIQSDVNNARCVRDDRDGGWNGLDPLRRRRQKTEGKGRAFHEKQSSFLSSSSFHFNY